MINLSNLSPQTVTKAPKYILCELQPVNIADKLEDNKNRKTTEHIFSEISIDANQILDKKQTLEVRK